MKQKLAIARALLHEPAVVFLDEPTAALDPEAAYIVREAIEALRRSGRTIVLATHNLDEADRLCDRVAFVRGGLLRVDSPAGLRGVDRRARRRRSGWRAPHPTRSSRPRGPCRAWPASRPSTTGSSSPPTTRPRSRPALVRALVAAGADIVAVRERATTLEQVYFEVMGVRPDQRRGRLMRGAHRDRPSCAASGPRPSATGC